jgi:signal peptidase I
MSKTETAAAAGRKGTAEEAWETIKTVVLALLIALVIRTILFQPYTIPSASEEPNLYEGDYIVVSKWSYGYSRDSILGSPPLPTGRILFHAPKRGDIVVFKLPRPECHDVLMFHDVCSHPDYIKRLVGLPGDTIQVRHRRLYINGKPLGVAPAEAVTLSDRGGPEPGAWVRETNPEGRTYKTQYHEEESPADNTGVYVVPQHCYFMMGDNRENSLDSRFDPGLMAGDSNLEGCAWDSSLDANVGAEAGVGFVPETNLEGRARMVMLSWHKGASVWKPWTWLNLRLDRFLRPIH